RPLEEVKSGFAEMLKHGLLKGSDSCEALLNYRFDSGDHDHLLTLLKESVEIKADVVRQDPHEHGIRRALNLGHTAAHAFESFAMQHNAPIAHGYAVAWGLVIDAVLSHFVCSFDSKWIYRIADFVLKNYGAFRFTCDDYDALIQLMRHDKKSRQGEINCTLLGAPGDIRIDCEIAPEVMKEAFDLYRDLMHI
ncbi:MAG: 3-dehydroquinate synthase, partial [bacterium]|nr:3-dehydroquinate synthase [bacterium]